MRKERIEQGFLWRMKEFMLENKSIIMWFETRVKTGGRATIYNANGEELELDLSNFDIEELKNFANYYGQVTIAKEFKADTYEDKIRYVIYASDMPFYKYNKENTDIYKVVFYESEWEVVRTYKSLMLKEVAVGNE